MIYNEKTVVWDITKPIFFLPKEVKKIYSKSYRSNFKILIIGLTKFQETIL